MGIFLVLIGFLGAIAFPIVFLIALIRKRPKKKAALGFLLSIVLFVVGGLTLPPVDTQAPVAEVKPASLSTFPEPSPVGNSASSSASVSSEAPSVQEAPTPVSSSSVPPLSSAAPASSSVPKSSSSEPSSVAPNPPAAVPKADLPPAPPASSSTPPPAPVSVADAPEENGQTVYYTKSGKKYHYENPCGNGTYYPCTLDEALRKGLDPCEKCVFH